MNKTESVGTILIKKWSKHKGLLCLIVTLLLIANSCTQKPKEKGDFIEENVAFAVEQVRNQLNLIDKSGKIRNPRTVRNGQVKYVKNEDWTSGFFPGTLWYLYQLTDDPYWKNRAMEFTETLDDVQFLTDHHDVGFMIQCSYGNGLQLTQKKEFEKVIVQSAKSLSTRYRPIPQVIQSWNTDRGWQSERGWECPVIIDNMMNLELLFNATKISGDSLFYQIAINHANRTLENHYRKDVGSYHVVDYDLESGDVRSKETAQGYADESAWARGQSWGIYGFTVCYRETGNEEYLLQAQKAANFVLNHPNMPADLIPYWDFNAPNIPNEPRDASSAAILASALYELSTYVKGENYKKTADKILTSLASDAYRSKLGENGNFILKHSVGSIPHGVEIDVPLNYADYYFLEALIRKRELD